MMSGTKKNGKIGAALLAGFLGSGKTTLLNHISSAKEDMAGTVIIVNEFGQLGIDSDLLTAENNEVIELTSGCICCTLSVDLEKTLLEVSGRFKPRFIFIEASGVADPRKINPVFNRPEIRKWITLEKVITVLDGHCWKARKILGTLFFHQLEAADLILVNKIDLLDKNAVNSILDELNHDYPQAIVVPTVHCRIDLDYIRPRQNREIDNSFDDIRVPGKAINGLKREFGTGSAAGGAVCEQNRKDIAYTAFSFIESEPLDEKKFKEFIDHLPVEAFRIKGPVRFRDQTRFLNHAGGVSQWTPWPEQPETRLAFVFWDLDPEDLIKSLRNCIA